MNRSDFQALAQLRLTEAQTLCDKGCFHGCYYLAGYVVECALKACIARSTMEGDFPDKGKVEKSWNHDLKLLLGVAGLKEHLAEDSKTDKEIGDNWGIAFGWAETSRYDRTIDETKARGLLNAVAESSSGVLAWLQRYW